MPACWIAQLKQISPKKRFRDRSTALSSPYETGRPPGAPSEGRRRHYQVDDWELRQQAARYGDPRLEELISDDDEEGMGQGVALDPNGYALRDARRQHSAFAGDELHFNGYDIGQDRQRRRPVYDYANGYDSEEEAYRRKEAAYQVAEREKNDILIQSALERIAKARTKGKTNVNLSLEEMEALERRRGQPPELPIPPVPLASPPATPARTPKGKVGSRTSSSTSLVSQKTRKRGNTSSLFSGQSSPSPAKSNSKAQVERKPSTEHQNLPYSPGSGPPGIMVPGPNGVPVFAPLVNYPPSTPEFTRAQPVGTTPRSRSTSKHSRHDSTPPERPDPFAQYPARYYQTAAGMRPESSSTNNRAPAEDETWYPPQPHSRNRSASNAHYAAYARPGATDDYDMAPSLPAVHGQRRNVSGPADVRYSNLRRVPPSSSPLAPRPGAQHASSDPAVSQGRKYSSLGNELERSSSGSSEDQGVQVNIVADDHGKGYSINRATAGAAAVGGGEERRRRGGRR